MTLKIICLVILLIADYPERVLAKSTIMMFDAVTTKAAVLKRIPIGTSIAEASNFMQMNGFRCIAVEHQIYSDSAGDKPNQQVTRGPANFLWCDSGERTWRFVLSKRWQVVFEDTDGRVSYISVGVGVTGP